MKKTSHGALLIPALLFCSNIQAQQANLSGGKAHSQQPGKQVSDDDIYKHYTGTIGGRKVSLDLRYGYDGSSNYGGSTYYFADKDERTLFYILQPSSFAHDVTLSCFEQPEDRSLVEDRPDRRPSPGWNFKIEGNELKGTWHDANDGEHADVVLKEDYSNSYPMDIVFMKTDPNAKAARLLCAIASSKMKSGDASFITAEQIRFLEGGSTSIKTWDEFERLSAGKYEGTCLMPVYNENGILVMENEFGNNIIGDHKLDYLSLDVRNHKRLSADDMLNIGSMKLSGVLEDAAREKYKIPADVPLSSLMLKERISSTKLVYPVHSGLVFCYNHGELVKDKEVIIHVPYRKLDGILRPEFSKRMGMY